MRLDLSGGADVNRDWQPPTQVCGGEVSRLVATEAYGLYHAANEGTCTRYDMALAIREALGRPDIVVEAVDSSVFPLPAPRPRSEAIRSLALQRLVASRSSASFNVAFYDEVFDHLDTSAHEQVVEVLSEVDKESVFVVSHDDDLKAWFPSTIRMVKHGGVSSVEI